MKSPDKHRKIIRAATKVFAKKGFFNARISDIAKEAKVADGTIYLYFNNKFDILLSVFEQEIGKLIDHVSLLLEKETNSKAMLEIFVTNHLQEMKKNRYLAEVIHIELRQTSKLIREYRKNKFAEYVEIIGTIIEKGQKDGTFRKDIQSDIARQVVFGALDEISISWHTGNECPYSIEEVSGQITSLFQTGLLHRTLISNCTSIPASNSDTPPLPIQPTISIP
jgi:TetR/AcrR family transcriptional regulator, fatty acid metabolism regulator protein